MILLPRLPDIDDLGYHPDEPPAGWYWRGISDDALGPHILVRCPHGHTLTLSKEKHQVAADGTVSPSLLFDKVCDFHEYARLDGWTAEDASRRASG